MIENLNGTHEIVNFNKFSLIKLYDNTQSDSYPHHWHSSAEIIMPIDNIYTINISNQTYVLQPNDLIFIWPGTTHQLIAPEKGRRLIFQVELSVIKGIKELNTILSLVGPAFVTGSSPSSGVEATPIHGELRDLFLSVFDEYSSGNLLTEASIYATFIEMLVLIGRHVMGPKEKHLSAGTHTYFQNMDKITQCCEYINAHYTENLTLDEMADMINFSKFHFSRLFKEITNVSFYQYVSQKRISHAETLLADPSISVTQVAIQSGFSTPIAFTRMFKLLKGCTPTEFRKIYQK